MNIPIESTTVDNWIKAVAILMVGHVLIFICCMRCGQRRIIKYLDIAVVILLAAGSVFIAHIVSGTHEYLITVTTLLLLANVVFDDRIVVDSYSFSHTEGKVTHQRFSFKPFLKEKVLTCFQNNSTGDVTKNSRLGSLVRQRTFSTCSSSASEVSDVLRPIDGYSQSTLATDCGLNLEFFTQNTMHYEGAKSKMCSISTDPERRKITENNCLLFFHPNPSSNEEEFEKNKKLAFGAAHDFAVMLARSTPRPGAFCIAQANLGHAIFSMSVRKNEREHFDRIKSPELKELLEKVVGERGSGHGYCAEQVFTHNILVWRQVQKYQPESPKYFAEDREITLSTFRIVKDEHTNSVEEWTGNSGCDRKFILDSKIRKYVKTQACPTCKFTNKHFSFIDSYAEVTA